MKMCLIRLPANYGAVEHLESLKNLSFHLFEGRWGGGGGGGGRRGRIHVNLKR